MYLTDFVFDDVKLSMLGYIVGSAVTSNNESASAGSKLELNTVLNRSNHINQIITSSYNEPITVTFDIIKYACNLNAYDTVEDTEIPFMMKWLNRTQYCKFQPIYDDLSLSNIFFMGTFTEIQTIQIGGHVIGFTLTFTANAPYGFADYDDIELDYNVTDSLFEYHDNSDDYGYHYLDKVVITVKEDQEVHFGSLLKSDDRLIRTVIKNCVAGEIITLDGIHKIISSSKKHPTLYKDFNYRFPFFTKTNESDVNQIHSMHPIHVKITYKPIKKVGIIV